MRADARSPASDRPTARLLVTCPDRSGVVARVSGFLADRGMNILDADQHSDPDTGRFFMRTEFVGAAGEPPPEPERAPLAEAFGAEVAGGLRIDASFRWPGRAKRVALLAGPSLHCAADLLWRGSIGELGPPRGGAAAIVRVVSNHEAAGELAARFGVPFELRALAPGAETAERERHHRAVNEILEAEAAAGGLDLVVLARYMQILPAWMCERWAGRVINIHHSFLPAFAGARPYHQAFARGVKLIGATSHYATAELDDGPIIAQDTARVSHRDTVRDLVRKGADLERTVLAEAVRLHLDDRVVIDGRKTVVFD